MYKLVNFKLIMTAWQYLVRLLKVYFVNNRVKNARTGCEAVI
jgi:hypothetical protein